MVIDMADQSIDVISGVNNLLISMGLNTMKDDITSIKDSINGIQTKQDDLKLSLERSELRKEVNKSQTENLDLQTTRLEMAENRIMGLEKNLSDCKTKIVSCQVHSMKDNLVFNGIDELLGEDVTVVIMTFLVNVMKLDPSRFTLNEYNVNLSSADNTVWIRRCHRFGSQTS